MDAAVPNFSVLSARIGGVPDPNAAIALVKVGGVSVPVLGASPLARRLAQAALGGPDEFAAPRPLTVVEHAVFAAAVAEWLDALALPGEVWPLEADAGEGALVELTTTAGTLWLRAPADAIARFTGAWRGGAFELPIAAARCGLPRGTVLAAGDTVIVERRLELVVGAGTIGLEAGGRVAGGWVAREPIDGDELIVQVGTARLSPAEVWALAGQVIPLGAAPIEVIVAGRRIGQGALVDVDGAPGVRIVTVDSVAEP